ncbi:hypothetical protein LSTR_LSTR014479, partial [Laodelphax striatellus]
YLDDSNESNRSRSIEDAQKFIDKLLSYVNCIDFDKIKAYSSEEAATKFGMKLLEKNELFAVLVFENQNGNQLTPFVSYKIRMSSDRVDNTEFTRDSRWRPGPRMRPYIDLKYLSMGFGYLQDLIEHYIIAEHTRLNATQLPGIYLQQFPYPCHINDNADPTLIYFFLLIYCVATIAQSFLISVFFSRANLAAASGGIIFFVLYLPYPFMVRWMTILPPYVKALMCCRRTCLRRGGRPTFWRSTSSRAPAHQWTDITPSPLYGDKFNLLYVISCCLITTPVSICCSPGIWKPSCLVWCIAGSHSKLVRKQLI